MTPEKSAVWNYFKRSLNGNIVKCTLCDAQLTFCGIAGHFNFVLVQKNDLIYNFG
jgi:hypothetical protein